jgi:anti-sigma B factor antagonist
MQESPATFTVHPIIATTSIISILGDLNVFAESALMDAYAQASGPATRTAILDLGSLDYMNSGGIGLLAMLLIRTHRQGQRVLAFRLSEHYRYIFELSRLNEAIALFDSEAAALTASNPS